MTDTDTRIEQFRKMASDDPDNELGHFSLGRALLDAGRPAEATPCFDRVIAINPAIGKAYQLKATALLRLDRRSDAIETLQAGARVAHERGDLMPKNEMLRMLGELGVEMPELASKQQQVRVGDGEVLCRRCGKVGPKLDKAPFRTPFGQEILAGTCAPCWQEAIKMGTKVINELRLPLADPRAQQMWDQHIREFLNL